MSEPSERMDDLSPLKAALLVIERMRSMLEAAEQSRREPIAIIGLGCRFPGRANDPEAFWRVLHEEVDTVGEIPADRWDVNAFYDPNPDADGKMYTRRGSFLEAVDRFDAAFFGISPREAVSMDPQQRLLLEVAWEALEHAGFAPDRLVGSPTGVFIGISKGEYAEVYGGSLELTRIDAYSGTGNLSSVAAGRLSYTFGFNGPTLAIDTACSSSLVAVHLACQSLRQQECEMALAGGVSLILSPLGNIVLSRARMIAADGCCRTFDAGASGYGRGEGCGVVLLKRLSDALSAGDRVLAVIRGSAVNHDGRSGGLTVPNGLAQQALLRRALDNAGLDPAQVSYVEAHGTGTPLGDPIEVRALAAVFGQGRSPDRPLLIGSVKSSIGHLEAAAGVAGLIKVVLSLSHEEIPRHLHLEELNPHIARENLPISVPTKPVPWPSTNGSRFAGISAFGLSGTNAHVVVEGVPAPAALTPEVDRPVHLLALSARTEGALLELARRFDRYLQEHSAVAFEDVCHTAAIGRSHFPQRVVIVTESSTGAREGLSAFVAGQPAADVFRGNVSRVARLALAFVFGGDESPWTGMGRDLYETCSAFRESVARCDDMTRPSLNHSLVSALYPEPGSSSRSDEPALARAALVAVEYALAELWRSWGIEPSVVIGDGVGEYAAAIVAGALTLEDGLKLAILRDAGDESTANAECSAPRIPIVTVSQRMEQLYEQECELLLEIGPGLRPAVRGRAARRDGAATWLPSSPGRGLDWRVMGETLAALYVRGFDVNWHAFDRPYPRRRLALPTYPFEGTRYWLAPTVKEEKAGAPGLASLRPTGNPLLGYRLVSPTQQILFESRYRVPSLPWLRDHRFYGSVIVAGATYLAMVIVGTVEVFKVPACLLTDIAFPEPMTLAEDDVRAVQLLLSPEEPGRVHFRIVSADDAELGRDHDGRGTWKLHAEGRVEWGAEAGASDVGEGVVLADLEKQDWTSVSADQFYRVGLDCGMEAGPSFKWISRLWRRTGEALAEMIEPSGLDPGASEFRIHPGLVDSCFQLLGACLPPEIYPPGEGQMPVVVQVDRFRCVRYPATGTMWARMRLRPSERESARSRFVSDISLRDAEGHLVFEVSGLHIQLVHHEELARSRREKKRLKDWVYEITWQVAPDLTTEPIRAPGGVWLIFCDGVGMGVALARSLKAQGDRCLMVFPGESFERVDQEQFRVKPGSPEDFRRLFDDTDLASQRCHGVIHLWSVDLRGALQGNIAEAFEGMLVVALASTLHLLQAIGGARWTEPPRLWLVTQGVQAIEADGGLAMAQSPIWGLGSVIALEHPELRCTRVDVDRSGGSEQGEALFREIWSHSREDQVAYRGGVRYVPRLRPGALVTVHEPGDPFANNATGRELFDPGATYLITGGLGALGRLVALWMVIHGARRLVLVSRSRGGPRGVEVVNELESAGAIVRVITEDVARYDVVAGIIAGIDPRFPLRGVVHAAGILDDGALLKLTVDRLAPVLSPKVLGAWNLHVLTRFLELSFFVLFSSSASVLGSPGQGSYAAANAFVDTLAHERRRQGLPALSINWGPWSGGEGMTAGLGESSEERWRRVGIESISPSQGLEVIEQMLGRRSAQAAVLPVDWSKFLGRPGEGGEPPFLSVVARLKKPEGSRASSSKIPGTVAKLLAASPGDRQALLIDYLRSQVAKVLELPPSHPLDPEGNLDELGLDSLMAIELRNALQETLGCPLPATLLYENPTLVTLAQYLLAHSSVAQKETR